MFARRPCITDVLHSRPAGSGKKRAAAPKAARQLEGNLGLLLVDFFRLYGRALKTSEVGVSASNGGQYFNKMLRDGDW